jgi:hypothetical protein
VGEAETSSTPGTEILNKTGKKLKKCLIKKGLQFRIEKNSLLQRIVKKKKPS